MRGGLVLQSFNARASDAPSLPILRCVSIRGMSEELNADTPQLRTANHSNIFGAQIISSTKDSMVTRLQRISILRIVVFCARI